MLTQLYMSKSNIYFMEGSPPFSLDYYVVEKELYIEGEIGLSSYGLEIIKKVHDEVVEYKVVEDIFFTEREITNLVRVLSEHLVTPTTVLDVIHDMVGLVDFSDEVCVEEKLLSETAV